MKKLIGIIAVVFFLGVASAPMYAVDPPKKKEKTESKACTEASKSDKKCASMQDGTKKCTKDASGSCCKNKTK